MTSDIFAGREALADHLEHFEPLTFAVPYGNFGQRSTNDPRIPVIMREFLERQFAAIFVQKVGNNPRYTSPRAYRNCCGCRCPSGAGAVARALCRILSSR